MTQPPVTPQAGVSLWTELNDLRRGKQLHHKRLRHRLRVILSALVIVGVVSVGVVGATHGLTGDNKVSFAAFWHSFVWTTSQLLTGGSSLSADREGAHVLEVVLELFAITAVAALAGSIATFFSQKDAAADQQKGAGV